MFQYLGAQEVRDALEFFVYTLGELVVLFLAISIFVSYVSAKLPADRVQMLLSGAKGYGVAFCLGAVTPFCSCSTLPMTIGLLKAGARFGPIMTFLFTSPLLNPYVAGLFWVSFGAQIALVYASFVIVLAMISGWLLEHFHFERYVRDELLAPVCTDAPETGVVCSQARQSTRVRVNWADLLRDSAGQFLSFVPYMVLGVAVGAVIHGFVPVTLFEQLSSSSTIWLIPVAALVGVFLYVRASTMVPIATSLVAKGMSMGAVMSLTIGGAGASLPEMIMMKRMFHWPLMVAFITLVFSTACITGFVIEFL